LERFGVPFSKLWKYYKFPMGFTWAAASGCGLAWEPVQDVEQSPVAARVDLAHSRAREKRYSRASATEAGQFGPITLVDLGDETPNLREKMLQELELAAAQKQRCLFVTVQPGCPTCSAFGYAMSTEALSREAGRLRVVRIDLAEFEAEIENLNLPIDRAPGLIRLNPSGEIEDFLEPQDWATGAFAEFGPTVSKFLSGKLGHRGTGGNKKLQSRAIDL